MATKSIRPSASASSASSGSIRPTAITGIDTRRLTRHLRGSGALPGAFAALEGPGAVAEDVITRVGASTPGTDGIDLVAEVTTPAAYTVGTGPRRVVAYDFGIKTSILRQLGEVATTDGALQQEGLTGYLGMVK